MSEKDPRYPVAQSTKHLPIYRALDSAHRSINRVLAAYAEELDLTTSQFDVLATLGDTEGLSFKELSEQSFVTGGTLTPVLKRLEAKGLIRSCKGTVDTRQTIYSVTPEGQRLYEASFLPTVDRIQARLDRMPEADQAHLLRLLREVEIALG
jgi:DNA-binding MarR family transcriptional regulator